MIEHVKKAILAGIGAAAITTEKAEIALSDLVKKGKLSAEEAKDAANKLADEGKEEFEVASTKLQSVLDDTLAKLGRGQKEKIESLEARVQALEEKLASEACCSEPATSE
ncbi:hypothetical protein MLD52_18125 [Puniceicoccaceae bacterium K14]|nr:hypothetical protein [Puniceicoccaceae bacterium K14]